VWINGTPKYVFGLDSNLNKAPTVGINVGYWEDSQLNEPRVGKPYIAHIVVGVLDALRGHSNVILGVLLPQATSFRFASGEPPFLCRQQNFDVSVAVDVTGSPSSGCPSAAPSGLPNGFFDLGFRDLPSHTHFEVAFELDSSVRITGEKLWGYVLCSDGEAYCDVPVFIRNPSGRLKVSTDPGWIDRTGVPLTFSVLSQDTGDDFPVPGIATITNFDSNGVRLVLQLATNTRQTVTFHYGHDLPNVDVVVPGGVVNCPGYQQDSDMNIPFKFSTF
jgi:hypothetical protein